MKKIKILLFVIMVSLFLNSCMTDPANEGEYDSDTATEKKPIEQAADQDSVLMVNARFIKFELGDASHFTFEDSTGKIWDFGGCEDKAAKFAIEIKQDKQNETNQGWESNPEMNGKWFNLKYVYRSQALYPDGPMAKVPIIIVAKMVVK